MDRYTYEQLDRIEIKIEAIMEHLGLIGGEGTPKEEKAEKQAKNTPKKRTSKREWTEEERRAFAEKMKQARQKKEKEKAQAAKTEEKEELPPELPPLNPPKPPQQREAERSELPSFSREEFEELMKAIKEKEQQGK